VRFLNKNQHTRRNFSYFVHRNDDELAKIGLFQSQFLRSKINLIFSKMIFSYDKLGEQLLLASFPISITLKNAYFVKMCPNFTRSPLFLFINYKNFRRVCRFFSKISLISDMTARNFIIKRTLKDTTHESSIRDKILIFDTTYRYYNLPLYPCLSENIAT